MADLIDSLMRISHEFRSLNLEPPSAIILADHEQGMRLLGLLHQMKYMVLTVGTERLGKPIEHPDGSVYMQIEIYGMKVQWPALKMALPDGGYAWI
jgi:hypothetical protein